jgi:hypothetical protein
MVALSVQLVNANTAALIVSGDVHVAVIVRDVVVDRHTSDLISVTSFVASRFAAVADVERVALSAALS